MHPVHYPAVNKNAFPTCFLSHLHSRSWLYLLTSKCDLCLAGNFVIQDNVKCVRATLFSGRVPTLHPVTLGLCLPHLLGAAEGKKNTGHFMYIHSRQLMVVSIDHPTKWTV